MAHDLRASGSRPRKRGRAVGRKATERRRWATRSTNRGALRWLGLYRAGRAASVEVGSDGPGDPARRARGAERASPDTLPAGEGWRPKVYRAPSRRCAGRPPRGKGSHPGCRSGSGPSPLKHLVFRRGRDIGRGGIIIGRIEIILYGHNKTNEGEDESHRWDRDGWTQGAAGRCWAHTTRSGEFLGQ